MIRRMAGICNIKKKARKARLRYLGHVLRRDHQHPVRRAYEEPVRGSRSAGRQRLRLKDVIRKDIEVKGLKEEDAADIDSVARSVEMRTTVIEAAGSNPGQAS